MGTVLPSMQILANTTRDVEILSPLKVQSSLTVTGDTTIGGNLTAPNLNPYWVAVVIAYTGGNPYFVKANGGRNTATALTRISGNATGFVQFDFPAQPQGTNYVISAIANGAVATVSTGTRTSTRIWNHHAECAITDCLFRYRGPCDNISLLKISPASRFLKRNL